MRLDVLCVDVPRLLQTVWELLFSTKQALQSSGKSPNAEPRCVTAAEREGGLCHTVHARVERSGERPGSRWLPQNGNHSQKSLV